MEPEGPGPKEDRNPEGEESKDPGEGDRIPERERGTGDAKKKGEGSETQR